MASVVLLVTAATWGMAELLKYSADRHTAARDFAQLDAALSKVAQLRWQSAVANATSLKVELAASERVVFQRLNRLHASPALSPYDKHELTRMVSRYLAALNTQAEMVASRNTSFAKRIGDERVDPAMAQLRASIMSTGALLDGRADRANAYLRAGVMTILPLTLTVAVFIRRRLDRAASLARSRARFEAMVAGASDVIAVTDAETRITYASPSMARVLGVEHIPPDGTVHLRSWIHPEDLPTLNFGLELVLGVAGSEHVMQCRARRSDGSWRVLEHYVRNLIDDRAVAGLVWNSRDVTERCELEEQLTHQAYHDPLTGLANRALLNERLLRAAASVDPGRPAPALILTDLDGFKDINDTYGHEVGDDLLTEVARRLRAAVRPMDTVARLGGDEFAILLKDFDNEAFPAVVAEMIITALAEPILAGSHRLSVSGSIGVASVLPDGGVEAALRDADTAMYVAKSRGKSQAVLFEPEMHRHVRDRVELGNALLTAAARGELTVLYQPIVDAQDCTLVSVEALVRWQHPQRGLLTPDRFVPISEENGAIVSVGAHVLRTACAQAAEWLRQFPYSAPATVGVNLSPRQLNQPTIVADIGTILDETGLDPGRLTLELTEQALIEDIDRALDQLTRIKRLGVRLAIDDFGTGYSSLSQLSRFPVDILKVDKSFLETAGTQGRGSMVRGIVRLAHELGLITIIEGVEDEFHAAHLRLSGSDLAQGYLFAKPVTAGEIEMMISQVRT